MERTPTATSDRVMFRMITGVAMIRGYPDRSGTDKKALKPRGRLFAGCPLPSLPFGTKEEKRSASATEGRSKKGN
jgi:hypothetical protein